MRKKHRISLIITTLFMFSCQAEPAGQYENLNAVKFSEALKNKAEDALLLDVRTPEEYASGHIEAAKIKNINEEGFLTFFKELPKETPLYVYCRSGARSGRAAAMLTKEGFLKVINLEGGIISWKQKGLPIVQ